MGKIYKILVCGKKAIGKTTIIEQLIYNRYLKDKYYATIDDVYVTYWEKDKYLKEKFRFYDTKGLENSNDTQTIESIRYLFTQIDGCILVYSSHDNDSYQCVEKLKNEIEKEKLKEKSKEPCHFIAIDYDLNSIENRLTSSTESTAQYQSQQQQQQRILIKNLNSYEISFEKRDNLCKAFNDLALMITQINTSTKSAIGLVQSIKKPKVFSK